jgi:hypothetical protein
MNRHIDDGLFSLNCVPENASIFAHIRSENLRTPLPYRFFFTNAGNCFRSFVE